MFSHDDLEEIEKRFGLLENRLRQKPTSLDMLYEINQIMPRQISLLYLNYEENNRITLHGQTQEINAVFMFVSALEKSQTLKGFGVKLRYATQKNTQLGEIVDFEIACSKR